MHYFVQAQTELMLFFMANLDKLTLRIFNYTAKCHVSQGHSFPGKDEIKKS